MDRFITFANRIAVAWWRGLRQSRVGATRSSRRTSPMPPLAPVIRTILFCNLDELKTDILLIDGLKS